MVCTGTTGDINSAVVICNKKVITSEIGSVVFSSLITLIAVHYCFELAYNPTTKQVFDFIQEILIGDPVHNKRTSTSYSNLYRSIMCIKQRFELEDTSEQSLTEDATEAYVDF